MATMATRREKILSSKNNQIYLTPTGLLMEGVYTQNPSPQVNECNGDVTPTIEATIPVVIRRFKTQKD